MSFQDIIEKILKVKTLQGDTYVPYVNGQGNINDISRPLRSDYDDARPAGHPTYIHGGVDINYAKTENGTLTWIGPNTPPNNHPPVYAPVSGEIIWVDRSNGQVSILCNGYVHTIYHMREIPEDLVKGQTITEGTVIGKMDGMYGGSSSAVPHHVHYEITTYLFPDRESKIDPEAFWNNDGTNRPFALTGSFKKGNIFYGTSNNEILKGEGELSERDNGAAIDPSDNDTLSGGGGSDIIDGKDGDDKLYGGNSYGENKYYEIPVTGALAYFLDKNALIDTDISTDYLIGGKGKDYLDGGKGNDYLYGGVATIANGQVTYNESEDTDTSRDTLKGGEGNDVIYGGGGDDWLFGNQGNDTMYGGDDDDYLSGGLDNDVMFGGKGNDVFWGDPGNDTMYGGLDNDTYFINPGDGNDTIEDKDGDNSVILCDKEIKFFYNTGDGNTYRTLEGSYILLKSTGTLYGPNGIVVTLNQNFEWGDFGTELITLPTNPDIGNTINGDLAPVDMDPEQPGIQYGYDQWGNVIVDPGQPSPDRADYLYDTPADDQIIAGGGDDYVICSRGGANWILGGDGYDLLDGESSSSSIIEGGAGSDIIFGGVPGNNQLFGENRGDGDVATVMATHIADGETAPDSGAKGDVVAVDGGDNFLYGSNGYDIMMGGSGKDLIVAGGGNDLIIGDGENMMANYGDNYNWAFSIQVDFDPINNVTTYTPVITGLFYYDLDSPVDNEDVIYAGTGNDYVDAGGGDDEVYGGAGNDTIIGMEGSDFIEGGDSDDILIGDNGPYLPLGVNGNDYIDGGAGNDSIQGDGGNDELYGGTGNDTLVGGEGDDYLYDEAGLNTLSGGVGDDVIFGGVDNDFIQGDDGALGIGNDYLDGGAGADTIIGAAGADEIYGGGGNDTLHGDASYVPLSDQGDDYIDGGAGDDLIYGYAGNNTLYGSDGNDQISGDAGDDYIDGGDGANTLIGGDGMNEIYAGTGDDQILGGINSDYIDAGDGNNIVQSQDGDDVISTGAGSDQIWGGAGADAIYGGAGNDGLYADDGNEFDGADFVDGEAGDDTIIGAGGYDTLYGGDGNDSIQGDVGASIGNDYLDGGAGADTLLGQGSDDTLYGGPGNDYMQADSGSDTYIFGRGDGADTIYNVADDSATAMDTIQIGAGINDVIMTIESPYLDLRISIIGTDDSLLIWNWGSDSSCQADQVVFSDGTVLTPAQVQEKIANPIYGTSANNTLSGGTGIDAIYGYAGDDNLSAGDGNDILIGGVGNDALVGGTGNDAYVFNIGDGVDTIQDTSTLVEGNTIFFGQGIAPSDLTVVKNGTTLTINVGTNGDAINLPNFDENEIAGSLVARTLQFADGTALAPTDFMNLRAPVVLDPIPDQTAAEEAPFTFTVPEYTFYDFDINDTLTYSATQSDGSALPSWLTFDPGTVTFSGTPNDAGDLSIKVTATDAVGHNVSDDFGLTVTNDVNDAPVVVHPIADQIALKDAVFNFIVPTNTFADVDPGDTLTYSATQSDGSALPSWLTFDPGTMTFSGTPGSPDVGILPLKVTATDTAGANASDEFNVAVDSAPALANPIDDQNATEDAIFSFTVPGNTFSDEDPGDTLTYSATKSDGSALPSWLTFDPGSMTFSGTPANADVGNLPLKVTATDTAGANVSDEFNVTVINVNDAPVVANPIDDQNAMEDTPFNFTVASNTFSDVDPGDTLTYSATQSDGSALPSWLTFDPGTMTFSGTPTSEDIGILPLKVTATDTAEASVSDEFSVTVTSSNHPPVVANPIVDQNTMEDAVFSFTVPSSTFADEDVGDTLTYSATLDDGSALPSWLTFDPETITFSGTPAGIGTNSIKVTAEDNAGASVSDSFNLEIQPSVITGTENDDNLAGGLHNNTIYGLGGNDTLYGGAGDDTLDGGTGADSMIGNAGNDTYIVDNAGDVVTENTGEGTDTVQSSVTYTLGDNVENLTLTGTSTINGNGNTLNNVITGNSANNTLSGDTGADSMIGGAGNDTYIVDNAGDVVTENAGEGTDTVQSSVTHTLGNNVENLTLTGTSTINATGNSLNNYLVGNSAVNTLTGGAGNDTLNGGSSWEADTMIGGAGNDCYYVDSTGDVVTENAYEGSDLVLSSAIYYTLGDNVEDLYLMDYGLNGTGNALDNDIRGNHDTNILTGGAGNDTLDGSWDADTMIGGAGNDYYYVDYTGDVVTEYASQGTDTVYMVDGFYPIISYTLPSNVENLILSSSTTDATGNDLDNYIAGNGDSIITGGAGNDTLAGYGADTLVGGAGDDIYYIVYEDYGNVVDERSNKGTDTVRSSVTYTLPSNVEYLTLTGTSAINGTGNSLNNYIIGNIANNILSGGGGADTMLGFLGDDTYVVDNVGDVVNEGEDANGGTDTVQSSVTYSIGFLVENLTLTGTSKISGTGNPLDNYIIGNSAINTLTGGAGNDTLDGGVGADKLFGGTGDDTYIVDNASDAITENAGEGTDTVNSSITYTLGSNVENLALTGTSAINGTGNTLDNYLTGNSAANTLTGNAGNDTLGGGAGNDSLVGGTGNDIYAFMRGDGQDMITDYDTTPGNSDKVTFGSGINPIDLILVNSGNNLDVQVYNSSDLVSVQNQNSGSANQVEVFEAGDGSTLLSSQVGLLIQAMADFSAQNGGMSWTELIQNRPADVQQILAQYWQPPQ